MTNIEMQQLVITLVVVILFLWRISYGANNGLFAEATGLVAVIAAFVAVYYSMRIVGNLVGNNLGEVIPKVGYLVIAFVIYKIMITIGNALKKIREIPILGGIDKLMGAVMGAAEAFLIVYIVEYITGLQLFNVVIISAMQLFNYVSGILGK